METYIALAIIITISVLFAVVALILEPREIADDVMRDAHGDVPRIDWE